MERAAFLLEQTGERIGCLLNPETIVVRRTAGVVRRQLGTGPLTGTGLSDDPLLFTGGGRTEITMELLFDVTLAGSSITTDDVRGLTGPLWELAENRTIEGEYGAPPIVRLVWGKSWNVPGVITAVAERLEYFTVGGAPQRSWLSIQFVRVAEPDAIVERVSAVGELVPQLPTADELAGRAANERIHEVRGGGEIAVGATGLATERLDEIAYRYFGDAEMWRFIAAINNIDDPLHLQAGRLLRIIERRPPGGNA